MHKLSYKLYGDARETLALCQTDDKLEKRLIENT